MDPQDERPATQHRGGEDGEVGESEGSQVRGQLIITPPPKSTPPPPAPLPLDCTVPNDY